MRDSVYSRQLGVLIFVSTFTFKVTRLPAILAARTEINIVALLLLSAAELVVLGLCVLFCYRGGFGAFGEKFRFARIALVLVLVAYCLVKGTVYFAFTVNAALGLTFDELPDSIMVVTLALTVLFLVYKGARAVARTAEIFCIFFLFVIVFTLFCIKSQMNFSANLPLMPLRFSNYLEGTFSSGVWGADGVALVFMAVKRQKKPFVAIAVAVTYSLVLVYYIVGNAVLGGLMPETTNLFVTLSAYNFFAAELGRLDWLGIVGWLMLSVLGMSVLLGAAVDGAQMLVNKRPVICVLVFGALMAVTIAVRPESLFGFGNSAALGYAALGVSTFCAVSLVALQRVAIGKGVPLFPRRRKDFDDCVDEGSMLLERAGREQNQ